jgi:4-diphosphocytidyl-2-C-methyl-D-erythritol kinase
MGICRAEGIGEILTPCARIPKNTSIVIAKGRGSVSTAQAYADFDSLGNYVRRDSDDIIKAFKKNDLSFAGDMFNRFEEVIFPRLPEVCEMKNDLYSCGALGALMSGSGSAVFGIFEDDTSATAALDMLLKKNVFACKTRPFYTE